MRGTRRSGAREYLDERLQTANEMLALARDNAERELQARNWLVVDHFERGDIAAVQQEIEAHEKLAERLRLPAYTWWGPMWRATLAILEGRYEEAERLIASFAGTDHPNARLYAEIQGYQLDVEPRALRSLHRRPRRWIARPAAPPRPRTAPGTRWILAARGKADEARAQIAWVAERPRPARRHEPPGRAGRARAGDHDPRRPGARRVGPGAARALPGPQHRQRARRRGLRLGRLPRGHAHRRPRARRDRRHRSRAATERRARQRALARAHAPPTRAPRAAPGGPRGRRPRSRPAGPRPSCSGAR